MLGPHDTKPVDPSFETLSRLPDKEIFKSPLIIFNQGFSKTAFSAFDVVFRSGLQAISGPEIDSDILAFLAATFVSPLAQYFAFHLTSKPIYRGKSLLNEILRMPFPMPQDAPGSDAAESVRAVAARLADVRRDPRFGNLGHHQLIQ